MKSFGSLQVQKGVHSIYNKTLRSVYLGVLVVELINCKCGGIVRNEIW